MLVLLFSKFVCKKACNASTLYNMQVVQGVKNEYQNQVESLKSVWSKLDASLNVLRNDDNIIVIQAHLGIDKDRQKQGKNVVAYKLPRNV